ncbi:Mu transposase C-terminal domain-containing protein [Paraburkholderia denitrificans]|uniref:Mu transposase C-terminal domain-containing protein n=1 Tax=Paraburkholderia denitrificans TaxID=694025 RepID=A0ABW0J8X6_9BURK
MHDDINHINPEFEPRRQRVNLEIGAFVQHDHAIYKIAQTLDFETAIGINVETGRSTTLRLGELRPVQAALQSTTHNVDLTEIADKDWQIAEQRFTAIKPLLGEFAGGREAVERRAKEVGVDTGTLYRWLQRYRAYEVVSALIPRKRGWKQGKGRISAQAEEVVSQALSDFYLTSQRPSAQKTIVEIQRRCLERGINAPGESAIRSRIGSLSERERLRSRGYKEKAKNRFLPAAGKFPNADYPLAVVQIDHTPADIILVDDTYRKPIGRPWITLAMDVHSRMVTGYYLSFDPPSETSVAMCVAHSVLPKEDWLTLHRVDAQWPVWGVPKTIHVDNGADFRSNNFQQSCLMYGINLEFRPVKQPRYGGHIERMLGTLLREIHALPGTTFSSVKERDGYDAEKHAALTKSEFEEWLVTLICKVYHRRLHSALMMSPSRKWEIGVFGNAEIPGVGIPPRPVDGHSILLDFLPSFKRTVQTFGVTIDGMSYYAEALRPWINAVDKETGVKREFTFRRDPRDISSLWFFDAEIRQYFKIPFADQALPAMSVWEYREVREKLKQEGRAGINHHQILRAVTELRAKVDEAQEKTKRARKQAQRRKDHANRVSPGSPLAGVAPRRPTAAAPTLVNAAIADLLDDVDPYGDIA